MPNPKLSRRKHRQIHEMLAEGKSRRQTMKKVRVSAGTVHNYGRTPLPDPDPQPADLPESWEETYPQFSISGPTRALLLFDIHIPFHTRAAVEAAVDAGKRAGCNTVILGGDALDFHSVSRYDHDGSKLTYQEEIEAGKQFMAYIRGQFPKAKLIYKEGNHEERLDKYILSRAPALFGIEDCTLGSLIGLAAVGAERVGEQRVIQLGKLRVIHGHEYGGGVSAPVSAARWLMLRARKHATCGHLHQTSEQIEQNIDGEQLATWSSGCLCGLNPRYRRLNAKWNHGFQIVDVAKDGTFEMRNLRIMNGKVV